MNQLSHLTLSGRSAWVCGASKGIGRAIAENFAHAGAHLTLIARDSEALAALCETLPEPGRHQILRLDLSDTEALSLAIQTHLAQRPGPDILVNNTGGPAPGPVLSADPASFENALRQHVIAAQVLAQALVPGMRAKGYGRILNIISTSVRQPIPGLGVSNTIRAAMASWAKTLATELAADGITVNNLLPGYTATERLDAIISHRAERAGVSSDDIRAQMLSEVPMRRFAEPAEIAAAALFLASPAAGYITGVSLPVDGGRIQAL